MPPPQPEVGRWACIRVRLLKHYCLYMIYDYISTFDSLYTIYDYISTFDSFRLILESIFSPLYYKEFYKHKGETLLNLLLHTLGGSWWDITLTYVKLHIISVKLQLTGKSSLTYQLYFSIHFQFREWYEMFKVENIHTQVHSVVLTIILCTFYTLPQLMKLLQRKSCPFSKHFLFALQRVHTLMSSMTCWVSSFSIQSCQFLHRYTIKR